MPYGTVNADLMTTSDGVSSSGLYGFKNRIINGAMVIDQRNAGASVTPTVDGTYSVDRMKTRLSQASKFSVQQSTTAPSGFSNSLAFTSLANTSVSASDYFALEHVIEGFNIADLNWGTANANTITLSFWVRSSLTGVFGGSLRNSSNNPSYAFSYTISSANTWELKTITVSGPTTGTWQSTTSGGIYLSIGLGVGSDKTTSAGSWAAGNYWSVTGATSVVGTNGATFYITGVQLEKGSVATSFDYRPYGTELVLCQRYFEKSYDIGTVAGTSTLNGMFAGGIFTATGGANVVVTVFYKVPKRTAPTPTIYATDGTAGKLANTTTPVGSQTTANLQSAGESSFVMGNTAVACVVIAGHYTSSAEL